MSVICRVYCLVQTAARASLSKPSAKVSQVVCGFDIDLELDSLVSSPSELNHNGNQLEE
jgi:hypothetical protein